MSRRYQAKFKTEKVPQSLNNVLSNSNKRAKRAEGACIQKHDDLNELFDRKFLTNTDSELSTDEENKENRKAVKKISEATRMNNRKPLKCSTRVQLLRKRGLPSSSPVLSSPSSSSLSSSSSSSSLSSISSSSSRPTSSESSASRSSSSSLSSSSTTSCHCYSSDEDTENDESYCHCGDV